MKGNIVAKRIVQIFFFALIAVIAVTEITSLHAVCPFGGVVTLYSVITQGTLLQKIHMSSIILMGLILISAILFGPVFCGWVCPLGSIQEWIGKLGKKIFPQKHNNFIPPKLDRVLRYLRILVLIWVVYITAKSGYLMFSNIDPFQALFKFWTEDVTVLALVVLGVTLVASLFVTRPWCRYLCPYGALLGFFNKIRIFKITRNSNTCVQCGECDRCCPMRINVSDKGKVTDLQCISCYECTSERNCPIADTVNMQVGVTVADEKAGNNRYKKITMKVISVFIILIIFGGIGIAMASNIWSTEYDRHFFQNDTIQSEEYIKGSTTFKQLLDEGITVEQIEAVIGGKITSTEQTVKDYCEDHGLLFSSVKEWLNQYFT